MVKSCVHKFINRNKLRQYVGQRVDQYQLNMLVQFGMGENVGQKIICRTRSINPKKIFVQNIGKVVRLTQHANIVFLHQTVQRSGIKIFASNIVASMLAKFVPCATPFIEQLLS